VPSATDAWSAPFRRPGFSSWALAGGAASFSWTLSNVAFSWVTLVVTSDPLAVGAVFAIRFVALMLFGIPAGVLADRVDRRRLVIAVSLGGTAVAVALAAISAAQGGGLTFLFLAAGSFLLGTLDTVRIAAGTAYTVDLVGPAIATAGIAVTNLVAQAAGIGGSAIGGVLLERFGLPVSFLAMGAGLALVALLLAARGRSPVHGADPAAPREHASLTKAFTLVRRDPAIALLTITVIVIEILGFSSMTLLPSFARDVFDGGPDAYGIMNAVRALGSVIGLLVLIRLGSRLTSGPMLMVFGGAMGVALVLFSVAPTYLAALLPLALFGAMAASMDSLSQSLMQRATADAERGAAMGLWTFAIGCGPIGHLAIGALAREVGIVPTQLLFGGLLLAFATAMLFVPRVRTLR
jgi:MFS family permease